MTRAVDGARRVAAVRWAGWSIGVLVLAAIAVALVDLFGTAGRDAVPAEPTTVTSTPAPAAPFEGLLEPAAPPRDAIAERGVLVQGVVVDPAGEPVAGATVTLFRAHTAWPEWRRSRLDEAITQDDGAFQFRQPHRRGLLLGFEHAAYAGGLEQVSEYAAGMRLELRAAFALRGFVLNDVGAPVADAVVSIESVPGHARRLRSVRSDVDGSFAFGNLAAGPARLVARHGSWQPAEAPVLVVGDRDRCDLRFRRPAMAPMRARIVDASDQRAIAGATVELLPINHKLGMVVPIAARSDERGELLLDGLPRGAMQVYVRHPEYGAVVRTQSIGAVAQDLLVEMVPRAAVRGVLTSHLTDDDAVVFAGDEQLELVDEAGLLSYADVAADGSFAFAESVSPGFATLRVVRGVFAFRRTFSRELPVRIGEVGVENLDVSVVPSAVVHGRFVDERGEPLAAVRVMRTRLFRESLRVLADAAWDLDVGAFGGGVLSLLNVDREQELAISDADGRFEVRGFEPGPLLGRALLPGRGARWLRMNVPSVGRRADIGDVVLPAGCSIGGRITRGNEPFAGAEVTCVSHDCQSLAITDADGRFVAEDLVPGTYSVQARITGLDVGGQSRTVVLDADGPRARVDLDLQLGRVVHGRVVDATGAPLHEAVVSVLGRTGEVCATDPGGEFQLELPPRETELLVTFGDRAVERQVRVMPAEDRLLIRLDTPPSCTLRARVFGLPGRRRLDGCRLLLTSIAAGGGRRARWVGMPEGELLRRQVPAGLVRIEIRVEGYAPYVVERTLLADETHDLGDVLLEPGARLRGVVRDGDGAPVRGAQVLLGDETDFDLFTPTVVSDADGAFEIQGVTSRSSQLVVRHPAFAVREIALQLPRDVLSAAPFEVVLERGATIAVTVPADRIPDEAIVYLRRQGRLLASAVLDERGRAWFANRSVGRYEVSLYGATSQGHEVEVGVGDQVLAVRLSR